VLSGLLIYIVGFLANGKITSSPAPLSAIAYSKAICAVLVFLSVVLHECSHGIAAIFFGLSVRHIRVALYLGFIPIVYLRINGLYTLRPRQRLLVWLAGPYANLAIASVITLVLYFHWVSIGYAGILRLVLIGNFLLVLLNLFPFLPTDGYYIASTLLGAYNVRTNAWSKFAKLFNGKPASAGQRIEIVYLVATLITISTLLIRRLMTGVHTGIGGAILTCISIGLFIFSLVTAQKTQRKPQSRVLSLTIRGLTVVSALCATRVDRLLMNHGGVHALMASILLRLHQQQARIAIGALALGCVATLSITYSRLLSSRIGERFFRGTSAKHKL
jgi:Zn-dependent protease